MVQLKKHHKGDDFTEYLYDSPLGKLLIVYEEDSIRGVYFNRDMTLDPELSVHNTILAQCIRELNEYFLGERKSFDVPISPSGTEFQMSVWAALREIPYGQTVSYGHIAKAIGKPAAVRAVGGANNKNPISIVVPCHRVIGADGKLVGYGGELWRKEWLLDLEKKIK